MALIGGYHILKDSMRGMSFINRHMLRSMPDHFENYSSKDESSYAVVTGGSDGIGLEICLQMAR